MTIADSRVPDLCALKWPVDGSEPLSWTELEEQTGMDRVKFRYKMRSYKDEHPELFNASAPQLVQSEGVSPSDHLPDEDEVFERARREYNRTQKLVEARKSQLLHFDHGPIAIVETADWHLGGQGVNYERLDKELRLIAETPGMFAIGAGDLLDQMIVGRLLDARKVNRLNIEDEWALLRRMLKIVQDKLLLIVMGNHDNWAESLTGISYFERELPDLEPDVIYDSYDATVMIQVGGWQLPTRIRHQWRGSSIYNPTHGIERAMKWDQGFLVGMGAHTHACGVVRSTNVGGLNGMAMMAGTYKRIDQYARKGGFPRPNASTSVAVVIDERNHALTGFDNLAACADYMEALY